MNIDFGEGETGNTEAENILRIVHRLPSSPSSQAQAEELVRKALAHLQGSSHQNPRIRDLLASQRGSFLVGLAACWRRIRGPSSGEMELSRQRAEALERAERAERSSFEALAETSNVERERDAANQQLDTLLTRIDELENAKSK